MLAKSGKIDEGIGHLRKAIEIAAEITKPKDAASTQNQQ